MLFESVCVCFRPYPVSLCFSWPSFCHSEQQQRRPRRPRRTQCIVTCVICWVCGMLGQSMRGGQSGTGREKPESERPVGAKPSLSSFLAPKARYNRDAAIKVLPLSFIFVVGRIVSLELIPKYVDFYFYDIIRCGNLLNLYCLCWRCLLVQVQLVCLLVGATEIRFEPRKTDLW